MNYLPFHASTDEQQLASAVLAHTARHDDEAVAVLLDLLDDPGRELRPVGVITALLGEFQRGMNADDRPEVADWFACQAVALAAAESTN